MLSRCLDLTLLLEVGKIRKVMHKGLKNMMKKTMVNSHAIIIMLGNETHKHTSYKQQDSYSGPSGAKSATQLGKSKSYDTS